MSGEMNVRLERMLRGGHTRVRRDRVSLPRDNVHPRAELLREKAMQEVDTEVLRAVETELMRDRTISRHVEDADRGNPEAPLQTTLPRAQDAVASSIQAEAVEWYRSASEQVEAAAHDNLDNLGVSDAVGRGKSQQEFLVHMWYVLAQMWRDLAAMNGNSAISERHGIAASQLVLDQPTEAQRLEGN